MTKSFPKSVCLRVFVICLAPSPSHCFLCHTEIRRCRPRYSVTTESVPTPPVSDCCALSLCSSVSEQNTDWTTIRDRTVQTSIHPTTLPPQALLVFKLSVSLELFFHFELQFVLCGGHWLQVSLYCGLYRLGHALSVVPAHCTA